MGRGAIVHCAGMPARRAVSLIEVLVATVLLAIGIHGTLGALAAAQRLHRAARERDLLAFRALDRLGWWAQQACAQGDTSAIERDSTGIEARWSVDEASGTRRLRWSARGGGSRPTRLDITTDWPCA